MEHPENRGGSGGPRRFDSKNGKAPPSRHLWVGNLSHSIMENDLTEHFLQFGELESVAFQPGRSYAFLNFKREDEAIAAMESLQGFPVAGNPLRIEFTKAVSYFFFKMLFFYLCCKYALCNVCVGIITWLSELKAMVADYFHNLRV